MLSLIVLLVSVLLINYVNSTELTDLYFKAYDEHKKDGENIGMSAGVHLNLNNTATCSYSDTCSTGGYSGACVSISAGCCSGTVTSGLCPGSDDIKCCTKASCSTPQGSGTCMQTGSCTGTSVPGYCVGPSDLQCCVKGSSSGNYGIDISVALTSSGASCLASTNSFIIPRGYQSLGKVDPNICNNLKTAYNAGIATRDAYLFPCPTCGNPSGQVTSLVNYLNSNCKSYWSGRIWLDIEGSQYWMGSSSSNQAFYKSLKDACSSHARCGIYSSYYQWEDIFGSTSFVYGNDLPLWYAHYDGNPSFSDFSAFGGWSKPFIKQYNGDLTKCSTSVDVNYSPYSV